MVKLWQRPSKKEGSLKSTINESYVKTKYPQQVLLSNPENHFDCCLHFCSQVSFSYSHVEKVLIETTKSFYPLISNV